MTIIYRSALVPVSVEEFYQLINDVERYPEFLDGVVKGEVLEQSDTEMLGKLVIRKAGLERVLITRNKLEPYRSIQLNLEQGPLTSLFGEWTLTPIGELGCKVTLNLEFAAQGSFKDRAFGTLFKPIADSLVDAFVSRATQH